MKLNFQAFIKRRWAGEGKVVDCKLSFMFALIKMLNLDSSGRLG